MVAILPGAVLRGVRKLQGALLIGGVVACCPVLGASNVPKQAGGQRRSQDVLHLPLGRAAANVCFDLVKLPLLKPALLLDRCAMFRGQDGDAHDCLAETGFLRGRIRLIARQQHAIGPVQRNGVALAAVVTLLNLQVEGVFYILNWREA